MVGDIILRGDVVIDNKNNQFYIKSTGNNGQILTGTNMKTHEDHLLNSDRVKKLYSSYEESGKFPVDYQDKSVFETIINKLDKLEDKMNGT